MTQSSETTPTVDELRELLTDSGGALHKASQAAAFAAAETCGLDSLAPPNEIQGDWLKVYTDHVWAYAGVYSIAATVAQIASAEGGFSLRKRAPGGEWMDVPAHPLLTLLRHPNPDMTCYDLFEGLSVSAECTGEAFWELVWKTAGARSGNGRIINPKRRIAEVWPVRSDRMSPVPRKDGKGIDHFVFQLRSHAKKHGFRPDQVFWFRYHNPVEDWGGLGSLQAAVDAIRADKQMAKWNLDFFSQGVVPAGVISTPNRLLKSQMGLIREQVRQFLSGKGRRILILGDDLQWKQMSLSQEDMEFLEGRREARQEILAALGVPPCKVGLLEHAKYDNYELQVGAYYKDTIIPKLRKIEGALSNYLLPHYADIAADRERGIEWELRFDTEELLREDEDKLVGRMAKMVEFGLITPNEARERLGLDPYPEGAGGDSFYMKSAIVAVGGETEVDLEMREEEFRRRLDRLDETVDERVEEGVRKALEGRGDG